MSRVLRRLRVRRSPTSVFPLVSAGRRARYGHIAPKTQTGKVVTIFYAILGIPLMLLCLSNIGDVMASSFRFLYWRMCCYVCTRPPKRRNRHHHPSSRRSVRGGSGRGSTRRRKPIERAHSDTDCRYRDSGYSSGRTRKLRPPGSSCLGPGSAPVQPPAATYPRPKSQPPVPIRVQGSRDYEREDRSPVRYEKYPRGTYDEEDEFPKISLPLQDLEAALKELEDHHVKKSQPELQSKSLPRLPKAKADYGPRKDFDDQRHYDIDGSREMFEMHDLRDVDYENYKERKALEKERKKDRDDYSYRDRGYDPEDDDYEFDAPRRRPRRDWREDFTYDKRRNRRARSAIYDYEPRWEDERDERRDFETARNRRLRRLQTLDDSGRPYRYTSSPEREDWSDEVVAVPRRNKPPSQVWGSRQSELYVQPSEVVVKEEIKPVPIWLCVFLVASYIVAGTFLFKQWEGWAYLDAAYFCFITLTTIGFGDFVPAQGQRESDAAAAVHSIALCSLYLLFGIALLAMSFNLVQEEVRANVASLATKLGIIKPRDNAQQDSDSDY
ncbi:hypothetical protein K1T71_001539 [Dendrolimus kikuchii]|uniref:Uncharacterized protein n=1 Tax=Dendrolimus kikuchii TaxID=765133 RepID=A0ACC1DHY9_9NEOP|nr:hypothetical protein K1T71_001539 [Dendrolimus kikuchii]